MLAEYLVQNVLFIMAVLASIATISQLWIMYFLQHIQPFIKTDGWIKAWFKPDSGKVAFQGAAGVLTIFLIGFIYWLCK